MTCHAGGPCPVLIPRTFRPRLPAGNRRTPMRPRPAIKSASPKRKATDGVCSRIVRRASYRSYSSDPTCPPRIHPRLTKKNKCEISGTSETDVPAQQHPTETELRLSKTDPRLPGTCSVPAQRLQTVVTIPKSRAISTISIAKTQNLRPFQCSALFRFVPPKNLLSLAWCRHFMFAPTGLSFLCHLDFVICHSFPHIT